MSNRQKESGLFVYPKRGWRKLFMQFPLYFWRMGLEPLLRQLRFIVLTTRPQKRQATSSHAGTFLHQ